MDLQTRQTIEVGASMLDAMMCDQNGIGFLSLGEWERTYEELFWRPYLGMAAYSLYISLRAFAECEAQGVWPRTSIEMIVKSMGQGDRYTILGREATTSRKKQDGLIGALACSGLVLHQAWQEGTRSAGHVFDVLPHLPVLTPRQAAQFDSATVENHNWFLGTIRGFSLVDWRKLQEDSLVETAVSRYGRVRVGG